MYLLQKSKAKISSRKQIDINGVRDGVLMLPNYHYCIVLNTSSLNFELKSEEEQDTLIDTYEGFLNSVGCPLQILIRTREVDMDKYLSDIKERLHSETEEIYRNQLVNYDEFIHSLISTNKILTRHFYVVVPYDAPASSDFEMIREQLYLLEDIVVKGLARLGMHSHELTSLEVLDLFYSFYNPELAKTQPLTQQALRLLHNDFLQQEN